MNNEDRVVNASPEVMAVTVILVIEDDKTELLIKEWSDNTITISEE